MNELVEATDMPVVRVLLVPEPKAALVEYAKGLH